MSIRASGTITLSEYRQIGGGCVGGLTCPCSVSLAKDAWSRSSKSGSEIPTGIKAAATLKHLSAHVKEALLSSGGQHGISPLSGIDIWTGVTEVAAPPVTGATTTETAMTTARNPRAIMG